MKKSRLVLFFTAIIGSTILFWIGKIFWKMEKKEMPIQENVLEAIDLNDFNFGATEQAATAIEEKNKKEIERLEEKNKIISVENQTEKPPSNREALEITNQLVNWGFEAAVQRTIDSLIIHSSYDALGKEPFDLTGLLKEYQQYKVAPHYLINRSGNIYRLVEDKNIAYHAGESQTPDGRKNVNEFSLGIEIMATQASGPTEKQYAALQKLVDFLKESCKIKYVLGHNQIAPGRKDDPWNFDWQKIK